MTEHRNCIHCQAIADGRRFFLLIEEQAKRENIDPERVLRGLEHAFAMWAAITYSYLAEDGEPIDQPISERGKFTALKLREIACQNDNVSAEFRAETERLLAEASHSYGRHLPHGRA